MRWSWLDLILELETGKRCVAIRNVTWGEDQLDDHFHRDPEAGFDIGLPVMPNSLVIEGMAQCAGILVGEARAFKHKVILAKIAKATFNDLLPVPGTTIRHTANIDRIDHTGASTHGTVELIHPGTGQVEPYGEVELMFSHIDQNRQGLEFPEHNFVFSQDFKDLLTRSGFPANF